MSRPSSIRSTLPRVMPSEPCTTYSSVSSMSLFMSVRSEAHREPVALARAVRLLLEADVPQSALVKLRQQAGAGGLLACCYESLNGKPEDPLHVLLPVWGCDGEAASGAGVSAGFRS